MNRSLAGGHARNSVPALSAKEWKIPETVDKCWKTKKQLSAGFEEESQVRYAL
jgi:hypothetical protein